MNLKKKIVTWKSSQIASEWKTRLAMESFLDGLLTSESGRGLFLEKVGTNPRDVLVEVRYSSVHFWMMIPAEISEEEISGLVQKELPTFLNQIELLPAESTEPEVRIRFENTGLTDDDIVRGRNRIAQAVDEGFVNEPQLIGKSGLPHEIARSLLRWMVKHKEGGIRFEGTEPPYGEYFLSEKGDLEGDIFEAVKDRPLSVEEIRAALSKDRTLVPDEEALKRYLENLVLFGRLRKTDEEEYENTGP